MARFIIEHKVTTIDGLKDFDSGGYKFNKNDSTKDRIIFERNHSE
jgi:cytoplasmic iron level regulating protein YaaA (DUF328/UPF0246 family)